MANQLNYNRIKFLCENSDPRITLEDLAVALGRSYSGFLKGLRVGSIYAHEILVIADQLNISVSDVYTFLEQTDSEAAQSAPLYIKRKRLADVSDPLAWVRLAMSKSKKLDDLIDGSKD